MAQNDKQAKIAAVRNELDRSNIAYKEFANGHFRIFFPESGNPMLDFWATTGKFKLAGSSEYHEGLAQVGEYINRGYQIAPQAKTTAKAPVTNDVPWD